MVPLALIVFCASGFAALLYQRFGPDFDRAALVDLSTDLFPKDEYHLSPP